MIIWVASYPRSGNTLLRTILQHCFNIKTYSDEIDPIIEARVGLSNTVVQNIGHLPLPKAWDEFYLDAQSSNELFFVKTHRLPRDKNKSIYVVRDGRQSLVSYEKYHQSFLGDKKLNLTELILGLDYYGSWANHFSAWRNENALILRYEDLVNATDDILKRIADFIGHQRYQSWRNPFTALNRENPEFFRHGESNWIPSKDWTPLIEFLFNSINSELMLDLGYAGSKNNDQEFICKSNDIKELTQAAAKISSLNKYYHDTCDERLRVIELLDSEVKRLQYLLKVDA